MSEGMDDEWVTVASFKGVDGDVQADLLVTTLGGMGIEALTVGLSGAMMPAG